MNDPLIAPAVIIPVPPLPPPGWYEAVHDDPGVLPILGDLLEEGGWPPETVAAVRQGRIAGETLEQYLQDERRRIAEIGKTPLDIALLPYIFAVPGLTNRQRLDAFLRISGASKKGIVRLRARQAAVRERLRAGPPGLRYNGPPGRSRGGHTWTQQERWDRRAGASGDAARALELAKKFHRNERTLYQSKRASVIYGPGGQAGYDAGAYSKAYRRRYGGARWRNAGCWVEYPDGKPVVIIQNFRGSLIARLALAEVSACQATQAACP